MTKISLKDLFDKTVVANGYINFAGFLTTAVDSKPTIKAKRGVFLDEPFTYVAIDQGLNDSYAIHVVEDDGKTIEDYVTYVFELLSGCKKESVTTEGGWIPWDGGKCPVSLDTIVEVRVESGCTDTDKAEKFYWHKSSYHHNIIAYRVIA